MFTSIYPGRTVAQFGEFLKPCHIKVIYMEKLYRLFLLYTVKYITIQQ